MEIQKFLSGDRRDLLGWRIFPQHQSLCGCAHTGQSENAHPVRPPSQRLHLGFQMSLLQQILCPSPSVGEYGEVRHDCQSLYLLQGSPFHQMKAFDDASLPVTHHPIQFTTSGIPAPGAILTSACTPFAPVWVGKPFQCKKLADSGYECAAFKRHNRLACC